MTGGSAKNLTWTGLGMKAHLSGESQAMAWPDHAFYLQTEKLYISLAAIACLLYREVRKCSKHIATNGTHTKK